LCSGYDYSCRHRRRFNGGPALGRVARLRRKLGADPSPGAPLPPRPRWHRGAQAKYDRLVVEIMREEAAVRASLTRVVRDLERRNDRR
jgi:hypothetical protein